MHPLNVDRRSFVDINKGLFLFIFLSVLIAGIMVSMFTLSLSLSLYFSPSTHFILQQIL